MWWLVSDQSSPPWGFLVEEADERPERATTYGPFESRNAAKSTQRVLHMQNYAASADTIHQLLQKEG